MTFLTNRTFWQLAIISGICIGLSYHRLYFGLLSYIGFIPIIHTWLINNPKRNFLSGYIFGIVYNIISNYWIATNSGAEFIVVFFSLISAVLYLSIFWGIAGYIIGLFNEANNPFIILPFLIVSLEWIRSFGPLGFPWGNLALTQMEFLPILQYIDYAGTYIIALWIVSINVILYLILDNKLSSKRLRIFILTFLAFVLVGWIRIVSYEPASESLDIAVIQPNIDPNEKWDNKNRTHTLDLMDSLYNEAIILEPDIILFPETALPTYLRLNNRIRKQLQKKVNISKIPILIGTVDRKIDSSGIKSYYNSTMFLKPDTDFEMYEKIHLVPFAEYDLMPKLLHPLGKLNLNIDRGVFKGGTNYKVFEWNGILFSDLICYESSLPRYARRFVNEGAELLMIQANDGWLGNSSGPYQHFEHARLRAIENRIPIARAGNTGISGIISPTGEVYNKVPLDSQSVFLANIPLNKAGSFYSKYGDVFAALCFVIFLFIGPVLSCVKE